MTHFRPAAILLAAFTLLLGFIYPLTVTGIARVFFPHRASGSFVMKDGVVVGSELVGQSFTGPRWFHGRPSATAAFPYDAANSAGSNLGPTNPALAAVVSARAAAVRALDPAGADVVPVDLVTASASGLDPHVTPEAAYRQVARVARARGLEEPRVRALVAELTEGPTFGMLGCSRVNVLLLNLALDRLR